jgi:hypothetical protein
MEVVESVRGPQYGSLWCTCVIVVGSVVLLFGLAAALGIAPLGDVFVGAIGLLIFSVVIQRTAVVTVDSEGVQWRVFGAKGSAPWSDIERVEGHRLSGRLVRRSSSKRVFFSMLDPQWRVRRVTLAIQAHLADVNPPSVA